MLTHCTLAYRLSILTSCSRCKKHTCTRCDSLHYTGPHPVVSRYYTVYHSVNMSISRSRPFNSSFGEPQYRNSLLNFFMNYKPTRTSDVVKTFLSRLRSISFLKDRDQDQDLNNFLRQDKHYDFSFRHKPKTKTLHSENRHSAKRHSANWHSASWHWANPDSANGIRRNGWISLA